MNRLDGLDQDPDRRRLQDNDVVNHAVVEQTQHGPRIFLDVRPAHVSEFWLREGGFLLTQDVRPLAPLMVEALVASGRRSKRFTVNEIRRLARTMNPNYRKDKTDERTQG